MKSLKTIDPRERKLRDRLQKHIIRMPQTQKEIIGREEGNPDSI